MIKVLIGLILLAPGAGLLIASLVFRFDNPAMTETQLWLSSGWLPVVALVFIVPAAVLIQTGWDEYTDPE